MVEISKFRQPIQAGITTPPAPKTPVTSKAQDAASAQGRDPAEIAAAIKTEMLTMLFSIKSDSKQEFSTQATIKQGGAGKGFDLASLIYNGKPLSELTQDEAQALVSADGFFGVEKTAARLVDFVLTGAGDDLARLQAGREGIQRGFKEAEAAFGGKLPEISYQTLEKALAGIDARIQELGGAQIDITA